MKKIKEKNILEKEFSREKTLMYMMMWDISERTGYKDFIGYDLKNSLFVYDPRTKKTAVWHDEQESRQIAESLFAKARKDRNFAKRVIKRLDDNWQIIFPYLARKKKIKNVTEFSRYYRGLIYWWSAMNTVYPLIENQHISKAAGKIFFKHRRYSQDYTDMMDSLIGEFWRKILNRRQEGLIDYLLIEEAMSLMRGKLKKARFDAIAARAKGFYLHQNRIYPAKSLNIFLKKKNSVLNEFTGKRRIEIKGVAAFRGIARGIVRKIIAKKDINDFKTGEILVAEMTSPSHVAMMKKAAAIITDEGGVTCHAAIVARELKIPCLIGTKIATKVLHDGDLVEVDADKGVVRLIK